ncbi:hypothetical protein HAX54_016305 [Datura stramonium]|uniref:Uncharacterized protein n=1 Tax=Datura stramonium TaxID=4076 RepID=A0ABS8UJB6_DATST|nr:hypothetical protein [Datura stramonium]
MYAQLALCRNRGQTSDDGKWKDYALGYTVWDLDSAIGLVLCPTDFHSVNPTIISIKRLNLPLSLNLFLLNSNKVIDDGTQAKQGKEAASISQVRKRFRTGHTSKQQVAPLTCPEPTRKYVLRWVEKEGQKWFKENKESKYIPDVKGWKDILNEEFPYPQ